LTWFLLYHVLVLLIFLTHKFSNLIAIFLLLVLFILPFQLTPTEQYETRGIVAFWSVVGSMKLLSFVWCSKKNTPFKHFSLFMLYPTLVFQDEYPRVKPWIPIFSLIKLAIIPLILMFYIYDIYVIEALRVYWIFFDSPLQISLYELFKIGYLSQILLLICFSFGLHLFPKVMGELTGFGDLLFHLDWWNADGPKNFWRKWNWFVHVYLMRHLYFECLNLKLGHHLSVIIVYTISGLLHEYVMYLIVHKVTYVFLVVMVM